MESVIQDALAKEAEVAGVIANVKEKVRNAMQSAVIPGVKHISSNPGCFTVPLHTLMQRPGMVLSAEYYSADAQANLVSQRLKNAYTMQVLIARIKEMANTGRVRLEDTQHQIHPTTREILLKYIEKE